MSAAESRDESRFLRTLYHSFNRVIKIGTVFDERRASQAEGRIYNFLSHDPDFPIVFEIDTRSTNFEAIEYLEGVIVGTGVPFYAVVVGDCFGVGPHFIVRCHHTVAIQEARFCLCPKPIQILSDMASIEPSTVSLVDYYKKYLPRDVDKNELWPLVADNAVFYTDRAVELGFVNEVLPSGFKLNV